MKAASEIKKLYDKTHDEYQQILNKHLHKTYNQDKDEVNSYEEVQNAKRLFQNVSIDYAFQVLNNYTSYFITSNSVRGKKFHKNIFLTLF